MVFTSYKSGGRYGVVVEMASRDAYGERVVEAHRVGDLHVHGLDEVGGCWVSWDSTALAGATGEHGGDLEGYLGRLAIFAIRAAREWHSFQRFSGFESFVSKMKEVNRTRLGRPLSAFVNLVEETGTNRVFLGLEEQNRGDEWSRSFIEDLIGCLRSSGASAGRGKVTPLVVFTEAYKWGNDNDLSIYESATSLCSPIFIRGNNAAGGGIRDPWLDGAAPGVNTGVLGAVTLNLPRAAFNSADEDGFIDRVGGLTELAVDGLEAKRSHLQGEFDAGRLPVTGSVIDSFDDFFCAIGVVGVHEALLNLLGKGIDSLQGKAVAYKTLEAVRDRLKEHERETGHRFCIIAEPSDSAAYSFAELDRAKYPEIKTSGADVPFYTGSTCLPIDYTDDLWDAMEHQKKLQARYNGGTIFNIGLERGISDLGGLKTLVGRIVEKTSLPCFAFSPTVRVCPPSGGEAERYERIGYWYKPVSGMGSGEREEVRLRRPYAVVSGW